jgi:hypothetical protein
MFCPECGCPFLLGDDESACTPAVCWCAKQPDAGDWHALADESLTLAELALPAAAEALPEWAP